MRIIIHTTFALPIEKGIPILHLVYSPFLFLKPEWFAGIVLTQYFPTSGFWK